MFHHATQHIRLLPDFIIIGAQKGGTTSLYYYLIQHPNIRSALTKEVEFFGHHYQRGVRWYRAQFPTFLEKSYVERIQKQPFLTGEASPNYFHYPYAPKRIAQVVPGVKLIALLRNPIDRAYSQYRHNTLRGHEPLSFAETIACDEERTREARREIEEKGHYGYDFRYAYLLRGMYADLLESWFRFFPREQVLVLKSEELYTRPAELFQQTLQFLNIPAMNPNRLKEGFKEYNKSWGSAPKMSTETRQYLTEFYAPHNTRLYELLDRDFEWR